jgi:hypothetical protein
MRADRIGDIARGNVRIMFFSHTCIGVAELLGYDDQSNFSRRDYSPCFSGSSYQTEMAITATLRFTGLPVR